MKKVSEHLGQIIVAMAGVLLFISLVVGFRAPIGDFFGDIISTLAPSETGFAGGTGTERSPYLVNDGSQLLLFNNNEDEAAFLANNKSVHLKLIDDIVVDDLIWAFNGSLDGNGHSITLSETFSSGGYPGLIGEVAGDTVIKNLNYVISDKIYSLATYNYSDPDASLTLENITVKGADADATYSLYNKRAGVLLYGWYGGDLTIKNCITEINIDNTAETSRTGLIVGTLSSVVVSRGTHGNRVVFDGVINKGTITASSYIGFFDGSGGFDGFVPLLVDSPDAPYSTEIYTYYNNDMCPKCFAAGATTGTVAHDGYCGANWSIDDAVNGQWAPETPSPA